MSYILDALRRADAERERGQVPGLHAQGASAGGVASAPPTWRAGLIGLGAGGALVVVLLGALATWRGSRTEPASSVAPASAAVPVAAPSPVVAAPPARPEPATAPAPALRVYAEPIARAPVVAATPAPRKPAAPPVAVPTTARPVGTTAASAPAAPPPIATLAELPDEIRRQLPQLAVGGSAYSTSPASRFVIVNGQLFHEGDALAPGLVLEQIRLKSAVLAFKGYRYGINF